MTKDGTFMTAWRTSIRTCIQTPVNTDLWTITGNFRYSTSSITCFLRTVL